MIFHPGQLVVCIDASGLEEVSWAPTKGGIYTVSEFGQPELPFAAALLGGPGLRLEEGDSAQPYRERWFSATRFRPLSEDRLEQFRAHLATPPRQKVSA